MTELAWPIEEFVLFAERARGTLTPGHVDWSSSPYGWMRANGPRSKSKLGKEIVKAWLKHTGVSFEIPGSGDGDHHLVLGGYRYTIHLALQGKEGKLEFAMLREPGYGVDRVLLLGVEPARVRIWRAETMSMKGLPTYRRDATGFHNLTVDPDAVPSWLTEVARWEMISTDDQLSIL